MNDQSHGLLTAKQAAALLNVKVQTLSAWRFSGRVPLPFVKLGASVRYREVDLQKFIAANTVTPTSTTEVR